MKIVLIICSLIISASSFETLVAQEKEDKAKEYFENKVSSESKGIMTVLSFKKTDGYEEKMSGIYVLEWEGEVIINREIWKSGNGFVGYWEDFSVMTNQPDFWGGFMGGGSPGHFQAGTVIHFTGDCYIFKTEKSIRIKGLKLKTYKYLKGGEISDGGSLKSNSANEVNKSNFEVKNGILYNGSLPIDGITTNIEVLEPTVVDEIGQNNRIKEAIYNLVKSSKRFNEGNTLTGNKSLSVKCSVEDIYASVVGSGNTTYFATMTIAIELRDKTTNKLVSNYITSITNSGRFAVSFANKTEALNDLIKNKLAQPMWQFIFSNFPIKTQIIEVTDINKKNEIKKVKILAGSKNGVHKDFTFKIDGLNGETKYDIIVLEVNDEYSICKVVNNQDYIGNKLQSKTKINVSTIYTLR